MQWLCSLRSKHKELEKAVHDYYESLIFKHKDLRKNVNLHLDSAEDDVVPKRGSVRTGTGVKNQDA